MAPIHRAHAASCFLWTLTATACGTGGELPRDARGDASVTDADIAGTTAPAPDVPDADDDVLDGASDADVDPGWGLLDEAWFAILPG